MLLELTDATYLRRLVKAINGQRHGQPMYVMISGEDRRVRAARFSRGSLQVLTMGSDMWFPCEADEISGVCASREPGRRKPQPKGKPVVEVFTIKRDELARKSAVNSRDLPQVVEDGGRRKRWVGIGWVDEGPSNGTEVLVIE